MEEYFLQHDIKEKEKKKKNLDSFSGPKTIVNDTTGHEIEKKKKSRISILRVRIWSNVQLH